MPHHHCCVSVQPLLNSCHVRPSLSIIVFLYYFRAGSVNIVKKKKKKKKGTLQQRAPEFPDETRMVRYGQLCFQDSSD